MKKITRILAAALTLCMLFALAPAASLAAAHTANGSLSVTGGSDSSSGSGSTSGSALGPGTATGTVTGVATKNVYFRTGPGTSYPKVAGIDQINKGTSFVVLDSTSYGDFWKIVYNGITGYVFADYAKITSGGSSGTTTGGTSGSTTGIAGVTTAKCNFRTGASSSASLVSGCNTIPSGRQVTILDNTSGGKYWKITYNGYTGWIYSDYVKISSGTTTGGSTGTDPGTTTSGKLTYAYYTGTSQDIWGSIQVDGTNINGYIYCNAIDSKGNFYYNAYTSTKNYFYALSYYTNPISVIYGHNMRKSGTAWHDLHHVQNAWLGISKCEYCGDDCTGAKTGVFNISYNGSTKWQVVGFFEISSATVSSSTTRKNINLYSSMQSNRTGAAKQEWIDTMMSYCNSSYKGMTLGSMTSSDKVMILVTCADKTGDSYQRLYFLLKAVG
jgi:uncharacterized protein YraI